MQRLLSTEHELARKIREETAQQIRYRDFCCTSGPLQFQELSLLCSLADDVVLVSMCLRLLVINVYVCLSHTKKVLNRMILCKDVCVLPSVCNKDFKRSLLESFYEGPWLIFTWIDRSDEAPIMNNDEQWKMIFKRIISRYKDYSVCSALSMRLLCETQGSQVIWQEGISSMLFSVFFCRQRDSRSCPLSQTWLSFSLIMKCCRGVVRGGMEPFRLSPIIYRAPLTLTAVQSQPSFVRSVIFKVYICAKLLGCQQIH